MIRPVLTRLCQVSALLLIIGCPAFAQATTFHTFPRFVDGRLGDGTVYKSAITILPWFDTDAPTCTINFYSMTAIFSDGSVGTPTSPLSISIPAGGFSISKTTGVQNFQGGYITITCDKLVFANVIYSFYSAGGVKLGEATVFSSTESFQSSFVFDHAEGALFGMAIANNTDLARVYDIIVKGSFGTRTTSVVAGARATWVGILQDYVSLPPNASGIVIIQTRDFGNHTAVALRFTGGVFTTVPSNAN